MAIPKVLHFVWVGNQALRPDECINTWRQLNPSYEIMVWDNDAFARHPWHNIEHIHEMIPRELNGVADIMRYEILYHHGGIALDADSRCVRPLEDWLLEPSEFVCWENEFVRPGLLACGAMGSVPHSPFFGQIIHDIFAADSITGDVAWKTVGPLRLTKTWMENRYPLTVYPSHYFIPNHFEGIRYRGTGPIFASQEWASTFQTYQKSASA